MKSGFQHLKKVPIFQNTYILDSILAPPTARHATDCFYCIFHSTSLMKK